MINVHQVGDFITGSVNGEQFAVRFTKEKYAAMRDYQDKANGCKNMEELTALIDEFKKMTSETYSDLITTASPFIVQDPVRNQYFLKYQNHVHKVSIPAALVDRMIKSVDKGIDITPLIKAWVRWLRNPIANTAARNKMFAGYINHVHVDSTMLQKLRKDGFDEEASTQAATVYQTPITLEGLLQTYKVSEEMDYKYIADENGQPKKVDRYAAEIDEFTGLKTMVKPTNNEDLVFRPAIMKESGDKFYCQSLDLSFKYLGHIIKVGHLHYLEDWKQVSVNRTGGPGLHVGNLDYIRCYQSAGTATHNILVDPMHIGGFSDPDGDGALVCKQYFVLDEFKGVNKNVYNSSNYASLTDAEFNEYVESTVKKEEMDREELNKLQENKAAGLKNLK